MRSPRLQVTKMIRSDSASSRHSVSLLSKYNVFENKFLWFVCWLVELIGWVLGVFRGWFGFEGLHWFGGGGEPFLKNMFLKRRIWRAKHKQTYILNTMY